MNQAQKTAWFGLAAFLFSDLLLGIYFVVMFIPRGTPVRAVLGFGFPAVTLAVLGILLWRSVESKVRSSRRRMSGTGLSIETRWP